MRSGRDVFALPVALVSKVDGSVAISPVDVNLRFILLERLELFVQLWRERKNKIRRTVEIPVSRETFVPRLTGLIAHDDIHSLSFQKTGGSADDMKRVFGQRKAIHDGANAHAAELAMSRHLGVEHHSPA